MTFLLFFAMFLAVAAGAQISYANNIFNIETFGAISSNTTIAAARLNGLALYNAIQAAHNYPGKTPSNPSTVIIPAFKVFTMVPYNIVVGIDNVVLRLDGNISAFSGDMNLWPNVSTPMWQGQTAQNVFDFRFSSNITFLGNGTLDGNGEHWWWYVIFTGDRNNNRPFLFVMESCINVTMVGWTMRNSPSHHLRTHDLLNGYFEHITIFVDVVIQKLMFEYQLVTQLGLHPRWRSIGPAAFPQDWVLPGLLGIIALNTDGIDIAGQNVIVKHCFVQNYDDALCTKPMSKSGNLTQCTRNILFEDHKIHYGVGASVGSVPPSPDVNCIRDVIHKNIDFTDSIKSIYVKPNPGTTGTGIIDNITYENIYSTGCMMWTIYASTQQEDQPGNKSNTGCSFFYPLPGTECSLQPRVPITRLFLKNVTGVKAALSPGILRCSDEGPCTGWVWSNVSVTSDTNWPVGKDFLCHGIVGESWNNVVPQCTSSVPNMTTQTSITGMNSPQKATPQQEMVFNFLRRLLAEEQPTVLAPPPHIVEKLLHLVPNRGRIMD